LKKPITTETFVASDAAENPALWLLMTKYNMK